ADSEGEEDFGKLDEDLSAVLRFARDQGRSEIFLIGASMGGTASLVVAAQEDVAGVVSISAPSEFEGQDALAAVANIDEPKLFIAAEDDTAAMLSLDELAGAASDPKDEQTYTGNAHGTNLFQSEHSAEIRQRVLDFLRENSQS
ncbi:MAG: dienelactone hydrolase family protein, partial [Dehalococcoidia bacterium]|nr:dienelactone hydrolase family protein [Dehalococcoidia bacterium]